MDAAGLEGTTDRFAAPVAAAFAAFRAVTVHEPVPVPLVDTVMLPEVPDPDP